MTTVSVASETDGLVTEVAESTEVVMEVINGVLLLGRVDEGM